MERAILCGCRESVCHNFVENINDYCEAYGLELVDEIILCTNSILASTNSMILEKGDSYE